MRNQIIVFLGPVGVGKSTQIKLLENYFHGRNNLTVSTYIKNSHIFAYILNSALKLLCLSQKSAYPDGTTEDSTEQRVVHRLIRLVAFLDTLSIAIKFFFAVYVPFHLGFTILIEEGPAMTLHFYSECFPEFFNSKPFVVRFSRYLLHWLSSKACVHVMLDATDEELEDRRRSRHFRRSELPEFVTSQRKWMQHLCLDGTFLIETGNKPIFEVHRELVDFFETSCFADTPCK